LGAAANEGDEVGIPRGHQNEPTSDFDLFKIRPTPALETSFENVLVGAAFAHVRGDL
jgi:hypothetical protein